MWMIICGSVLLALVLIACIPVGLKASFISDDAENEGLKLYEYILFYKKEIDLAPKKKKKKKIQLYKTEGIAEKPTGLDASIRDLTGVSLSLILKALRHVKIKVNAYEIRVATDDAAKTALLFGAVNAATAGLFGVLESCAHFRVKKRRVNITTDFSSEKTRARIKIVLTLTIWEVLLVLISEAKAMANREYERMMAENAALINADKPEIKTDK